MNDATPLVSVAMATYNGAKYLAEQLDSILGQTYSPIEIVITDDCSADNTVAIIKEYQSRYSNIIFYPGDKNVGVTAAFERAISYCTGSFIALADQDDVWEKDKIECLVNAIGKEDAVYSDSLLVDHEGNSLNKPFSSLMTLQPYYTGTPFLMGNCIPGHTIMMRSDFAKKIMPFPRNIMFDRWISYCAAGNNGIAYVPKTLVRYRQHDNNTIGVKRSKNQKRKTKQERFNIKLGELQSMTMAPISQPATKAILTEMLRYFHRSPSFGRSAFFFRNLDNLLVIKKKSGFRKFLYCLKMFFKPNY